MSVITEKPQLTVSNLKWPVLLTGSLAVCSMVLLFAAPLVQEDQALDLGNETNLSDLSSDNGPSNGRFMRAISTTADMQDFDGTAGDVVSSRSRRDAVDTRISYLDELNVEENRTSSRTRR